MLRAVIFDMDGVIVDSEPLHVRAEKQTLKSMGIEATDEELRAFIGRTAKILFEDFIRRYELRISYEEIRQVHRQNLLRLFRDSVELIPGILPLFDSLKSSGILMAVASSSSEDLIQSVLDRFSLGTYFSVVVSGEKVEKPKPHPDIFLETQKQLGFLADECVVVEDSTAGVEAAHAAGIPCVGFTSPNSHLQDLSKASLIVHSMSMLNVKTLSTLVI